MKNNIFKYALMFGVGLALASCAEEELGSVAASLDQPLSHQKTFEVTMAGGNHTQKALVNFLQGGWIQTDHGYETSFREMWINFTKGDSLSVFANGNNYMFNNSFIAATNFSREGWFVGDAEDADTYYALFPAQPDATISGSTIKAVVASYIANTADSTERFVGGYQYNASGAVCVGYSTDNNLTLHHATGYLGLMNINRPDLEAKSIDWIQKIVVEAPVNIAGDVTISGVGEDKPVATGGSSKTITLDNLKRNLTSLAISMLPVKDVELKITCYRMDGAVFTYKFPHFSVEASQCVMINQFVTDETFKVTFKDGSNISESEVVKGTPLSSIAPNWTRDGYTLKWLDEHGNVYDDIFVVDDYYSFSKGILSNRTFTASWEKIEKEGCFLTYPTKDGEKKIEVEPGYVFTLPELPEGAIYWENPKYPDHGNLRRTWESGIYCYGRQATDFRLQPGDKVQIFESTTLYSNQYNRLVTVDANGGLFEDGSSVKEWRAPDGLWVNFNPNYDSDNMAFVMIYFDYSEREPDQLHKKPVREGYKLVGFTSYQYGNWNDEISWNSVYCNGPSDIKFIAQWAKTYKIEYLDENGKVANNDEYIDGEKFELDYILPSNGKIQTGWKDQDGNILRIGVNYMSVIDGPKDLRLTPVFSEKPGSTVDGYDEENFDRL